jgi:hypothetical protein
MISTGRPNYLSRPIDLVTVPSTPAVTYTCEACDLPDKDVAPLVDVIRNPFYDPEVTGDPNNQFWLPVIGQVPACGKDWHGVEDYVEYDFGTGGTYHRPISVELIAIMGGLSDCDLGADSSGVDCQRFPENLRFDELLQRWVGEFDLVLGTLRVEVFGTYDGVEEFWWVEYKGCGLWDPPGTPNVLPGTVTCHQPLRFGVGTDTFVRIGCCSDDEFGRAIYIKVKALIPPLYIVRPVDQVRHDGTDKTVMGIGDCCGDECIFDPGCCNRLTIDETIDYTLSNFVVSGAACVACCAGPLTQTPTDSTGCITWSYSCPMTTVVVPLCLICDTDDSIADGNRGWEHYRLFDGVNYYAPSEGNCEPFYLLFEAVTVTVPIPLGCDPGTVCTFSYDVTVSN